MLTISGRAASYGMQNTTLQTTQTIERVLFTFGGIALYNMLELLVMVSFRFKSWKGLYFWSLIIATVGILPYTLGLLFKFFGVIQGYPLVMLAISLIDIGWQMMVTVQRAVLWMIIANWFISNIPTTVFVFGAASPHPEAFTGPYGVWERLQLCLYFVQEVIISYIYGYEVMKMLKPELFDKPGTNSSSGTGASSSSLEKKLRSKDNKQILRQLLWINVVIVCLDITLLVVEFSGHYEVQVLYKAFVYSVKLKLEFRILNQLTDVAQTRIRYSQAEFGDTGDTGYTSDGPNRNSVISQVSPTRPTFGAASRTLSAPNFRTPRPLGILPDIEKYDEGLAAQERDMVAPFLNDAIRPADYPSRPSLESNTLRHSEENKRSSTVRVSFIQGDKTEP